MLMISFCATSCRFFEQLNKQKQRKASLFSGQVGVKASTYLADGGENGDGWFLRCHLNCYKL